VAREPTLEEHRLILIYKKLTRAETKQAIAKVEQFFADHPRRRVCHTNLHGGTTIRRGHVAEDVAAAVDMPDVRMSRTLPKHLKSTKPDTALEWYRVTSYPPELRSTVGAMSAEEEERTSVMR
jgi:hypothetical protein